MKKLLCFCLVLLLCFGLCVCKKSLPELSDNEKETITLVDTAIVSGTITKKLSPNVLVLEDCIGYNMDEWGDTAYVITDDADEWCIGDEISVKYTKADRPNDKSQSIRIYAENIKIIPDLSDMLVAKPIIYFYPETPMELSVKVEINGELTCTYPDHGIEGWQNFTAYPDGTLVFPDGKEYYALYWEGVQSTDWDFSKGFCVRGKDTADFLEWALAEQGLTPREANEFIIYWLPLMEHNAYNVISFQTDKYTENATLSFSTNPDSLLRVFMAYYASEKAIAIEPQSFEPFQREGFTVVEWGGSQIK
ncbi:MAG: hypothetical protein IIW23_00655 [Clostridia bacterium]|nr:hypothetical protein [Clostridia bacterium]